MVKEIKLQKLTQISQFNDLLQGGFVEDLNRRFAKMPADDKDAHHPAPPKADLYDIFICDAARRLHKDYTIRFNNQWYQIVKTAQPILIETLRGHFYFVLTFTSWINFFALDLLN